MESTSRCPSQMWMSSVPLTASIAPRPKMPALLVTSRYRGRRRGFERAACDEVRAGLASVVERQAAPDGSHLFAVALRRDRLRTDRMPVRLTPPRLVVAQAPAEVGHLRPSWDAIGGLIPAMGRL